MADNRKFPSVLAKRLKTDISATDTTFKLPDIKWYTGSDGVDVNLASTDFGTVAYGVFEPNTARQEFFTWDPTTIANYATTGISILARGLPWSADYTTESSARKWGHDGGTKVLLMTNAPAFYDQFTNKNNDETIVGLWTFPTGANYPLVGASYSAPTDDKHVATKKYVDDTALAGAPDMTTTVKGVAEEATLAELNAGTAAGGTSARLAANPSTLHQSRLTNNYAADAGSTDAYAITSTVPITAYVTGKRFTFKANTANTGPATLNVDGLGALAITREYNIPLTTGDIKANQLVEVVYDGSAFQMVSTVNAVPTGTFFPYPGRTAPNGYLLCDGSAVSRTTYATLFSALCPTIGTFTVTIASPGVVTLTSHGLATGDSVYLTTTGALPTGLSANTRYWVIRVDANTFQLATSQANALAGTGINTSGSQSGTHTATGAYYGIGDGSTTFNVPSLKGLVAVGLDQSQTEFAGLGQTGGEKTHALTTAELATHSHTMGTARSGGSGGTATDYPRTVDNGGGTTALSGFTGDQGSGTAHNNIQPYVVSNYIIKT